MPGRVVPFWCLAQCEPCSSPDHPRPARRAAGTGSAGLRVRSCRVLARPHPGATVTTANRRAPDRQPQRDDHGAAVKTRPADMSVLRRHCERRLRRQIRRRATPVPQRRRSRRPSRPECTPRAAGLRTPAPDHAGHEVPSATPVPRIPLDGSPGYRSARRLRRRQCSPSLVLLVSRLTLSLKTEVCGGQRRSSSPRPRLLWSTAVALAATAPIRRLQQPPLPYRTRVGCTHPAGPPPPTTGRISALSEARHPARRGAQSPEPPR
jgi:hypothetical protein